MADRNQEAGPSIDELVRRARTAQGDEVGPILHHRNEEVLFALLENPHLRELQIIRFLQRRDLPQRIFPKIAGNKDWMAKKSVRLALAKNPKVPRYVWNALLPRFLPMELVQIASDPFVGADRRIYIDRAVAERVPMLPLGTKMNLARRAGPGVLEALLLDNPPPKLMESLLPNKSMTEHMLVRGVGAGMRHEGSLALIAAHPEWGKRQHLRRALAKNPATPHGHRARIIAEMTAYELREVLIDCSSHRHIIVMVEEELDSRPGDGRSKPKRPMSREEVEAALKDLKKRRKPAPKKSAADIRGASADK
ncbi:MAG: hypothetical protein KDH09_14690, partial [Chrysiogenetes bacterium]|nr:hypothetical protein [Chrysiogenetes bacterium]